MASYTLYIDKAYKKVGDQFLQDYDFKPIKLNYNNHGIQIVQVDNDGKIFELYYRGPKSVETLFVRDTTFNDLDSWGDVNYVYYLDSEGNYQVNKDFKRFRVNARPFSIDLSCVETDNCDYYTLTYIVDPINNKTLNVIINSSDADNLFS